MSVILNPERKQEKFQSAVEQKNTQLNQSPEVGLNVVGVSEVSDFMDGLDVQKPSESISERTAEDDKKQRGSATKNQANTDDNAVLSGINPLFIPTQKIMVRKIRNELIREINTLLKQAKIEEKKGPYHLNEIMYKVRELKGLLSSLANSTYEFIKNLYITLFEKKNEINQ